MLTKKLFFGALLIPPFIFCMEELPDDLWTQEKATVTPPLEISIETPKRKVSMKPITHQTTIADVKNFIENSEGIPTAQQSVVALSATIWSFWFVASKSPTLSNQERVMEIMAKYRTKRFGLSLTIQDQTDHSSHTKNQQAPRYFNHTIHTPLITIPLFDCLYAALFNTIIV